MVIKKINYAIRCDIGMCPNQAKYGIENKGKVLRRQLNLCEDCIIELYECLGKLLTPKSPNNVINRKDKS